MTVARFLISMIVIASAFAAPAYGAGCMRSAAAAVRQASPGAWPSYHAPDGRPSGQALLVSDYERAPTRTCSEGGDAHCPEQCRNQ